MGRPKKEEDRCTLPGCKRKESCSHTACPMRKTITAQPSDSSELFQHGSTFYAKPTQKEDYE